MPDDQVVELIRHLFIVNDLELVLELMSQAPGFDEQQVRRLYEQWSATNKQGR